MESKTSSRAIKRWPAPKWNEIKGMAGFFWMLWLTRPRVVMEEGFWLSVLTGRAL